MIRCSVASMPTSSGPMASSTASTAFLTPLPPYRAASPSRSSTASYAPVLAPLGTAARAKVPSSRTTSTSMVGLPRESRISRAPTASMDATGVLLGSGKSGRTAAGQPSGGSAPCRAGWPGLDEATDDVAQRLLGVDALGHGFLDQCQQPLPDPSAVRRGFSRCGTQISRGGVAALHRLG